ncbi:hypothetical protein ACS0TY_034253 [Phlomoides rotata]
MLTVLPNDDEVRRAIFDMEPSISPGLDGFGGNFYQVCWDIISLNVIEAIRIFTKILASRLGDIDAKILTPFQFGFLPGKRHVIQISRAPKYLFYVDDILIFAKATIVNIRCLQSVLSNYGSLFGQLYNPTKSKVYCSLAVNRRIINYMLHCTCITIGFLPFTYLGVPLCRGSPRTCHLTALADSIISKFSKWKGHSLSLAGRKCVVNIVIAASLVHSMMINYWPRSFLKKVETAMRNFIWTGDISKRNNSCSVSWARYCSPHDEEGLDIRSLRISNDLFICNLAWDILCNKSQDMALI